MKKHTLLRILCGLTFLIFLCPFYQACSDEKSMKEFKTEETVEETVGIDTIATTPDADHHEEHPEAVIENSPEKTSDTSGRINNFTGYEMVVVVRDVINGDNVIYLCFSVILLFSIIMLIQSLRRKSRTIYILSILNLLLAFVFLAYNYLDGSLEEITQIKYGYYLFIINTFAITLLSKKLTNHGI